MTWPVLVRVFSYGRYPPLSLCSVSGLCWPLQTVSVELWYPCVELNPLTGVHMKLALSIWEPWWRVTLWSANFHLDCSSRFPSWSPAYRRISSSDSYTCSPQPDLGLPGCYFLSHPLIKIFFFFFKQIRLLSWEVGWKIFFLSFVWINVPRDQDVLFYVPSVWESSHHIAAVYLLDERKGERNRRKEEGRKEIPRYVLDPDHDSMSQLSNCCWRQLAYYCLLLLFVSLPFPLSWQFFPKLISSPHDRVTW